MNDVNVSALDRETKLFATIDELKAENERIRGELARIKPSWDDAPEWAKWLASDEDGDWEWYEADEIFFAMGSWFPTDNTNPRAKEAGRAKDYDLTCHSEPRPKDDR